MEEKEEEEENFKSLSEDDDLLKDLTCLFTKVHETTKQFSRKNSEDFAGKKIFSSSSLKFI